MVVTKKFLFSLVPKKGWQYFSEKLKTKQVRQVLEQEREIKAVSYFIC